MSAVQPLQRIAPGPDTGADTPALDSAPEIGGGDAAHGPEAGRVRDTGPDSGAASAARMLPATVPPVPPIGPTDLAAIAWIAEHAAPLRRLAWRFVVDDSGPFGLRCRLIRGRGADGVARCPLTALIPEDVSVEDAAHRLGVPAPVARAVMDAADDVMTRDCRVRAALLDVLREVIR